MKRPGFTRNELILTGVGLLVLAGLLIFAVVDARRRSRDAARVSTLRQMEFRLMSYRNAHASYPGSLEEALDGVGVPGYSYTALPVGCQPDGATLCSSYVIGFALEGRFGAVSGGACESSPEGINCVKQ